MKWKDWVKAVEKELARQGIDPNPEIFYIDTHMPQDAEEVGVVYETDPGGVAITGY